MHKKKIITVGGMGHGAVTRGGVGRNGGVTWRGRRSFITGGKVHHTEEVVEVESKLQDGRKSARTHKDCGARAEHARGLACFHGGGNKATNALLDRIYRKYKMTKSENQTTKSVQK